MNHTSRRHYDSHISWLYKEEKEHVLSPEFRKTIPYSTISTWRNNPTETYGVEFTKAFRQSMELHELIAENKRLKQVLFALTRAWIETYKYIKPALSKNKEYNEHIINKVQQLQKTFSISTTCRLFSISKEKYFYQLNRLKYVCVDSPLSLCFRRNPLQLCQQEINCLKDAFDNHEYSCWPAISIYYNLLRNKKLNIGLSTFYKYVNMLGLKRRWRRETRNSEGVKTTRPNEYLHVDTTYVPLPDNSKAAVVFVSDNFSKAILGYTIAYGNKALNVAKALRMTIETMIKHHEGNLPLSILMADGGSENHAKIIEDLLNEEGTPPMKKIIAQKDIQFSNSPVEAINKIVKRYLRKMKPNDFHELQRLIPSIIEDYNHKRPHGALKGLMPWECYTKKQPDFDFKLQIQLAKNVRIAQNKRFNCSISNSMEIMKC